MKQKKWRGTVLFVVVLTVMGLTVGLRLYGSEIRTAADGRNTSAVPTASKTINGAVVDTPYGPIQVNVTFSARTITAITELRAPNDRSRSIQINSYASPILMQEVLASQSSNIDTVSGATYTSEGYARSVQSAIDKL